MIPGPISTGTRRNGRVESDTCEPAWGATRRASEPGRWSLADVTVPVTAACETPR